MPAGSRVEVLEGATPGFPRRFDEAIAAALPCIATTSTRVFVAYRDKNGGWVDPRVDVVAINDPSRRASRRRMARPVRREPTHQATGKKQVVGGIYPAGRRLTSVARARCSIPLGVLTARLDGGTGNKAKPCGS